MAMIDYSFINSFISEFDSFFTKLARQEQAKESEDSEEDISSTVVHASCEENQLILSLNTNKNNDASVWMYNYATMARSLFAEQVREYLSANPEPLIEQCISPLLSNLARSVSK